MKILLCCIGLLAGMGLPNLHAGEVGRSSGVHQAAVEAYLRAHIETVSRSGDRVVLSGDGEVFAVKSEGQNITGFSDRIVLSHAGDSFVANFGAKRGVNTVLTLGKANASGIVLNYRVLEPRDGAVRMDAGTVFLSAGKTGAGA